MRFWRRPRPAAVGCQQWVELVTDYMEGHLDAAVGEQAKSPLAECPTCVEYLAQIRTTVADLGRVPSTRLSPQARSQLVAAYRQWSSGANAF